LLLRRANSPHISRSAAFVLVVAALAAASTASGGGIADEPCPNVAGEHTNTCPAGTVGAPYHLRFRENEGSGCGPGRQTFHLDSGALPAGLVLSADGTLRGTPRQKGRFEFYVEMREPQHDPATCAGKRTQKRFTLWVREPVSITALPASPPRSEVGVPLRLRFRARGGTGVFTWTAVRRRLPPGIRARSDGSLAGIPRTAGSYDLEVRVWDTEGRSSYWAATLQVAPRLVLHGARLPAGRVGHRYATTLTAERGVAPRRWTLLRGRLPLGLRFLSSGRLMGIPRDAGRYRITVQVRDALGVRVAAPFTISVLPRDDGRSSR
jgi:hypothetical protein